jgi:hypothetical protein
MAARASELTPVPHKAEYDFSERKDVGAFHQPTLFSFAYEYDNFCLLRCNQCHAARKRRKAKRVPEAPDSSAA